MLHFHSHLGVGNPGRRSHSEMQPGEGILPARENPSRRGERGVALLMGMFLTILVLGMILSGTIVMESANRKTDVLFRLDGQARQFAQAGLIDALSWFRRQTSQPVTSFAPIKDTTVSPPILDTDDPSIGIVREFEISRGVWGRYEVRKEVPFVSPPEAETEDISIERGGAAPGTVWRIVSRGYVFRLKDASVPFNQAPNQMLGTNVLETEIRRITLAPPTQAALCVQTGGSCSIGSKARVVGGVGAGIGYKSGTGSPSISGEVSGSPSVAPIGSWDDSVDAVFGVTTEQLRSLADDRISSNAAFPSVVPTNSILFVETDLTFNAAKPLKGTGIVYVDGDLTIDPSSNSFFTGMLYVTGNVTIHAPSLIRGTIVALGNVSMSGVGDYSELEYDDGVLNALMVEVGQYRMSKAIRKTMLKGSLKN